MLGGWGDLFINMRHHIEQKRTRVEEQRLVVQEQLGQQTEELTVQLNTGVWNTVNAGLHGGGTVGSGTRFSPR